MWTLYISVGYPGTHRRRANIQHAHFGDWGCKLFAEILVLGIKASNPRGTVGGMGSKQEVPDVSE